MSEPKVTRLTFSHASTVEILRACLWAMNAIKKQAIGHYLADDTYQLAALLTNYLIDIDATESLVLDGRSKPYRFEVHVLGLAEAAADPVIAEHESDVTEWLVDLRLYLATPAGYVDPLFERSCATYEEALTVSDNLLKLFPHATVHEWPER